MAYTKIDADDVEAVSDGLTFMREPLGTDQLGVSILECEPGWTGMAHDHDDDGQEEVYVLVDGEATVVVEDEDVPMQAGEAIRVPPRATRRIENGDVESRFVLVGAP